MSLKSLLLSSLLAASCALASPPAKRFDKGACRMHLHEDAANPNKINYDRKLRISFYNSDDEEFAFMPQRQMHEKGEYAPTELTGLKDTLSLEESGNTEWRFYYGDEEWETTDKEHCDDRVDGNWMKNGGRTERDWQCYFDCEFE